MARPPKTLVKWYGDEFKRDLNTKLGLALALIGRMVVARIQRSMGSSPSQPGQPPGRVTSSYARRMDSEVSQKKGSMVVRVGTNDKRGPWLELGTGSRARDGGEPYIIRPKRRKALRFTVGGRVVFARQVVHPGIHPRPHIVPGVLNSQEAIVAILKGLDR